MGDLELKRLRVSAGELKAFNPEARNVVLIEEIGGDWGNRLAEFVVEKGRDFGDLRLDFFVDPATIPQL